MTTNTHSSRTSDDETRRRAEAGTEAGTGAATQRPDRPETGAAGDDRRDTGRPSGRATDAGSPAATSGSRTASREAAPADERAARTPDAAQDTRGASAVGVERPERPTAAPPVPARPATEPAGAAPDRGSATGNGHGTGHASAAPRGGPATDGSSRRAGPNQLNERIEHAIGTFVDDPHAAVREADGVLNETTKRLARLLEEHRSALRKSWSGGASGDTERLRVALIRYRDLTQRLLDVV